MIECARTCPGWSVKRQGGLTEPTAGCKWLLAGELEKWVKRAPQQDEASAPALTAESRDQKTAVQ